MLNNNDDDNNITINMELEKQYYILGFLCMKSDLLGVSGSLEKFVDSTF